jgi:hypothetical protein
VCIEIVPFAFHLQRSIGSPVVGGMDRARWVRVAIDRRRKQSLLFLLLPLISRC